MPPSSRAPTPTSRCSGSGRCAGRWASGVGATLSAALPLAVGGALQWALGFRDALWGRNNSRVPTASPVFSVPERSPNWSIPPVIVVDPGYLVDRRHGSPGDQPSTTNLGRVLRRAWARSARSARGLSGSCDALVTQVTFARRIRLTRWIRATGTARIHHQSQILRHIFRITEVMGGAAQRFGWRGCRLARMPAGADAGWRGCRLARMSAGEVSAGADVGCRGFGGGA
jgi:hypothetical protein